MGGGVILRLPFSQSLLYDFLTLPFNFNSASRQLLPRTWFDPGEGIFLRLIRSSPAFHLEVLTERNTQSKILVVI